MHIVNIYSADFGCFILAEQDSLFLTSFLSRSGPLAPHSRQSQTTIIPIFFDLMVLTLWDMTCAFNGDR